MCYKVILQLILDIGRCIKDSLVIHQMYNLYTNYLCQLNKFKVTKE